MGIEPGFMGIEPDVGGSRGASRRTIAAMRSLAARCSSWFALEPGHREFTPRSSRTWLISLACDWSAVFEHQWWA